MELGEMAGLSEEKRWDASTNLSWIKRAISSEILRKIRQPAGSQGPERRMRSGERLRSSSI